MSSDPRTIGILVESTLVGAHYVRTFTLLEPNRRLPNGTPVWWVTGELAQAPDFSIELFRQCGLLPALRHLYMDHIGYVPVSEAYDPEGLTEVIARVRLAPNDVVLLKTPWAGEGAIGPNPNRIAELLREKAGWDGALLYVEPACDFHTMPEAEARRLYEALRDRFEEGKGR